MAQLASINRCVLIFKNATVTGFFFQAILPRIYVAGVEMIM